MTRETAKVIDGVEAREISAEAFARQPSDTAANASKRLFGPSGKMKYRVVMMNGKAQTVVNVEAETGDEAAEKALLRHQGLQVAYVGPATKDDAVPAIDVVDGE